MLPEILKICINCSACKAAAKIEWFGQLVHFLAVGVLRNQKLESADVQKEVDVWKLFSLIMVY
jgi:hypothetical protein